MADAGAWMPVYWGDYLKDTMHLTCEEHGAYLLLIAAYWNRGGPIPNDEKWLASASKLSVRKWRKVNARVTEFFSKLDNENGSVLVHERVEKEILRSSARLKSARANGKAGGLAKSKLTTITYTDSPNGESQKKKDTSYPKKKSSSDSGISINREFPSPDGTMPECPEKYREVAIGLGIDWRKAWPEFWDYWVAMPGQKGRKTDWLSTFRNRCRDHQERKRFPLQTRPDDDDKSPSLWCIS